VFLISCTGVCPEINEVYLSPIGTKDGLLNYCKDLGCRVITYSPLMDLSLGRIPEEAIKPIASKYKKSIAQVILRWNVERGCLPLPKTKNPSRLSDNFNVFDFKLTENEVALISALNYDYQYLVESKICPGI
jgi:diketogulonate reductase-like aldo/keto reductase